MGMEREVVVWGWTSLLARIVEDGEGAGIYHAGVNAFLSE